MIKLINGDCLEAMKQIPDGSIDMILTDPPYGTTACKWDSIIPLEPMWEQLTRVAKKRGAVVLFGSEPFSSRLRLSNIKSYKFDFIYRKPQGVDPLLAKKRPLNDIEMVSVFYRAQPVYNPQYSPGHPYHRNRDKKKRVIQVQNFETKPTQTVNSGTRLPKRVLDFKQERGLHPTQKPVALMEYLIKTYTNEGEIVLDFTMGSGPTGVACKNLSRDFIGIELDGKSFEIAKDRIDNFIPDKHYS